MALAVGTKLLNGRYELIGSKISESGQGELWGARDTAEYAKAYMLKAWPFYADKPPDVQRALWDSELRTLYRVRSTPGSEQSLLQLHNVGIDHNVRYFVMIFKTQGLQTLTSVLNGDRSAYSWLSGSQGARRELWQMLGNIADGLDLLHQQQVVHRCVSPDSVFLEPGEGPESCRLGGFEWSIRLGQPAVGQATRMGWETPPEQWHGSGFGPDADWYAFGILAARCMLGIEHLNNSPVQTVQTHKARHLQTLNHLRNVPRGKLLAMESDLIRRLIEEDPALRYRHHSEIANAIREIIRELQQAMPGDAAASRHLVIIDPRNHRLVEACLERGLRQDLALEPGDAFDVGRPAHVTKLLGFLYRDFRQGGLLTPIPNRDLYCLSGSSMHLRIGPAHGIIADEQSWQNAFCTGALDYATNAADSAVKIPAERLKFFSTTNMRDLGNELGSSASWEAVLPRIDRAQTRRAEQERFSEFVRITNQIDILIRDAELFRCRVIDVQEQDGICIRARVVEIAREHPPLQKFRTAGGMAEFLLREKSSGKAESSLIQLYPGDVESIARRLKDQADWQVEDVDIAEHTVTLVPAGGEGPPPKVGEERVLRTKGLSGQVLLIKRRKEAIDRLNGHNYLLESVTTPGAVLMDSTPEDLLEGGGEDLPVPLSIDTVDRSKLGQIKKILGVRPIYALQGPPGTGKTHLVAWLLREILEEDPVAQILITAQAHPAVDVLRAKVEEEAFHEVPINKRPLAIRLRRSLSDRSDGLTVAERGSEQYVTRELLENTITELDRGSEEQPLAGVQADWHAACDEMLKELATSDATLTKEFRELVKRSASITYSTTSDGDLAALADEVSYDWSIVEEAGKAHGFELALPMYLGHRWLLIGDPKQLPPYRIEDYQKAVSEMDATVEALEALDGDASMLDRDFLRQWRQRSDEERAEFKKYSQAWLKVFEQLHKLCSFHEHEDGLLSGQHRMHPDIGELISEAYYDFKLEHYTRDPVTQEPEQKILHGLSAPPQIAGKAVVWLDIPTADVDPRCAENNVPKYRNFAEARALDNFLRALRNSNADRQLKLAILSPYAQQVGYLRDQLNSADFQHMLRANGIRFAPDPRRPDMDGGNRARDGFFTVDSFQGNQAEIIAVSMVRNNTELAGKGLGFLVDGSRMNVLLSRAERLLVLIGSWEFFRSQVSHVSRDKNEPSELQHLAVVLDRLEAWFAEGKAVRIAADLSGLTDAHGRELQARGA
jgi:hypothetical protein